jgi:predicted ester cyclase
MLRWSGSGTHTGQLMNIPPTGKSVRITGMDILKLENGKIKERWAEIDALGLMQQLGVIPSGN